MFRVNTAYVLCIKQSRHKQVDRQGYKAFLDGISLTSRADTHLGTLKPFQVILHIVGHLCMHCVSGWNKATTLSSNHGGIPEV